MAALVLAKSPAATSSARPTAENSFLMGNAPFGSRIWKLALLQTSPHRR
jgi:hypothetical protein